MDPDDDGELHLSLLNLSNIRSRMDQIHSYLTESLNTNTILHKSQTNLISNEITTAINQLIVNATTVISTSKIPNSKSTSNLGFPKTEVVFEEEETGVEIGDDLDIVELDAVELLAEHLHFCEFCGKGFKRDANLRMHMRAHGNKFKTLEALSKPIEKPATEVTNGGRRTRTRFSCPFTGCSRNKLHKKFRPLKSVICVKNHFKRSHCPKMYSCNRCNKKNFSVLSDLKSHLRHCGETKWKCSCGTSFSRKDKLFGHMTLFKGHMPAVPPQTAMAPQVVVDDDDDMFFDGLGSIDVDDFCIQDLLASTRGFDWNM